MGDLITFLQGVRDGLGGPLPRGDECGVHSIAGEKMLVASAWIDVVGAGLARLCTPQRADQGASPVVDGCKRLSYHECSWGGANLVARHAGRESKAHVRADGPALCILA